MPIITVGPVIGTVTSTTARVLIETDKDCTVSVKAVPRKGTTVTASAACSAGRPSVLTLAGLAPETAYDLSCKGATNPQDATVKTCAESPDAMRFAIVSCNYPGRLRSGDPWAKLRDRCFSLGEPVDVLMHIGDQVYADDTDQNVTATMPFEAGRRKLMDVKKPTKVLVEEIRESYRQLYRDAWSRPSERELLANVSNLMIIDDHEVCDDWGTDPNAALARTPQYANDKDYQMRCLVARQGVLAYFEYQKQLRTDLTKDDWFYEGPEYHSHRWGDIGAIFLDLRNARSYTLDPEKPFLTRRQWQMLRDDLGVGGTLSGVRSLLVLSPIPLVFLDGVALKLSGYAENDVRDHWGYVAHKPEQLEMVKLIDEWKAAGNGQREALVVGGDLHMCGDAEIFKQTWLGKRTPIVRQIITSPITNAPPSGMEAELVNGMSKKELELTSRVTFRHWYGYKTARYRNVRNFAVVTADAASARLKTEIVAAE